MSVKAPAEKKFRRARKVKPVKKRTGSRWVWLRMVSLVAAGVVGLYATYRTCDLVLHASALKVHRILVRGNVRLSSGEVRALVDGLRGSSILTADLPGYRARLLESPWVADVALRRVLPSTVEVFVSERRPIGLCRIGRHLYLLDRSGTIIDEFGPKYAQFDLPIIDGAVRSPASGEPIVDERRTALAASLLDGLAVTPRLASRVSQIDVSDPLNAVVLLDDDPALLHLGSEKFAERLQGYLDLAARLRETVPEIEYADLRFEDRIYVRPAKSALVQAAARPAAGN
ncbi:MAG TPA: FtsQ-type POTRA domain-containing protein [Vicinamibacterales bacterium]|nr:FtsQ-type POTRA domain-containing protein [Vicinamibacterales bacterium]